MKLKMAGSGLSWESKESQDQFWHLHCLILQRHLFGRAVTQEVDLDP